MSSVLIITVFFMYKICKNAQFEVVKFDYILKICYNYIKLLDNLVKKTEGK